MAEVKKLLGEVKIHPDKIEDVVGLLLWFGFLGIYVSADDTRYSYHYQHDVRRMQKDLEQSPYCSHPGFHKVLGCKEES
ncbi:MAG: hypothetical protein JSV46_00355 [Candidatus Aminicenantes bacterium]|nr:MAG: hypothetical protein JSV46_00355 [Candidatus Aminicenantes bacterium]